MEEAVHGYSNIGGLNNISQHAESEQLQMHKNSHAQDFKPNNIDDQVCVTKSQHFSPQSKGISHDPEDRQQSVLKNSTSLKVNNNFQLSKLDLGHSKSKIRMYGSKKNLLAYTALVPGSQCQGQELLKEKGKSSKDIQNRIYLNLSRPLSSQQNQSKKKLICSRKNIAPSFTFIESSSKIGNDHQLKGQIYQKNCQRSQSVQKQNRKDSNSKVKVFGRQRKITAQIDLIPQNEVSFRNYKLTEIKNCKQGNKQRNKLSLDAPVKFNEQDGFDIHQAASAQKIFFQPTTSDHHQIKKHANNKIKPSLLSNKTIKSKDSENWKEQYEEEKKPKIDINQSKDSAVNMTLTISQMENQEQIALIKLPNYNSYNYYSKVPSVILTPSKKVKAHFQYITENDKQLKSIRHGQFFNQNQNEQEFVARLTSKKITLAEINKKIQKIEEQRSGEDKNIFEGKIQCSEDLENKCNTSEQKFCLDSDNNNIYRNKASNIKLEQESVSRKSQTSIVHQARRLQQLQKQQIKLQSKNTIQERDESESVKDSSNQYDVKSKSSSHKIVKKRLKNAESKSSNLSSLKKSSVILSSSKKIKAHVDYISEAQNVLQGNRSSDKKLTILSSNKSLNAYIQDFEEPDAQQQHECIYDYDQNDTPQGDFILQSESNIKQNLLPHKNSQQTKTQSKGSQMSISSIKLIDEFIVSMNKSIANKTITNSEQKNISNQNNTIVDQKLVSSISNSCNKSSTSSDQEQTQKTLADKISSQTKIQQKCQKTKFILQNEENKEKQINDGNCPQKQLMLSHQISHSQFPCQSSEQSNFKKSKVEHSNPSVEDAARDLKKQQKSEKDPLNIYAHQHDQGYKKQSSSLGNNQITTNFLLMQNTTQQKMEIPKDNMHCLTDVLSDQNQPHGQQTLNNDERQKQKNQGNVQKQISSKQNLSVTVSKRQQNSNFILNNYENKNSIQTVCQDKSEQPKHLQIENKTPSKNIIRQSIQEQYNKTITVIEKSIQKQSALNCKIIKQKECSINKKDHQIKTSQKSEQKSSNVSKQKPTQSSQNNKKVINNSRGILKMQNGSSSLRSLASSGSQIQLMPLQPSGSQVYLNGEDKIKSKNSDETAQKLGSSIKSISQRLKGQKERTLNTLVKVSPRHQMKNKTEPKQGSNRSVEGFSSSQFLSSSSKISSSHKLQNARDSSSKQNSNQPSQIKKIGYFKFKENKEQYRNEHNKYINESIDEKQEEYNKSGKIYQSPLKRRNMNKKIKIPSPYFSPAFSNLKLGSSKNQTSVKNEVNQNDFLENSEQKNSRKNINHDDSEQNSSKLKKKLKKPLGLFNEREMEKLTVEYQKIRKIQESESTRKQKLTLVQKNQIKQKQIDHAVSLDRHKNHTKSQKFLKAHSYQFSYLYPTAQVDEGEKLNQKVKQLDKKLKRSSYTVSKKRQQDEVHEYISEARREVRQSQKYLAEFES